MSLAQEMTESPKFGVIPIDDGLAALETLCEKLADVPTPAGPTPRNLRTLPMYLECSTCVDQTSEEGS